MKKVIFCLIVLALFAGKARAQVTIGSGYEPHPDALLDLKETNDAPTGTSTKGLLMPRVKLVNTTNPAPLSAHVAGMTVYNTDPSGVGNPGAVTPGFYYNDGQKWVRLSFGTENWFYMPSIAIDVTTSGTFSRDLYLEYRKQFEDTKDGETSANSLVAGTPLKASPGAPNPFTKIYAANELYYYVTGYDATVFSFPANPITADGVLTYTVNADNVTGATFMNIVFGVK
jgi:hypothetical protein